MRARPASPRARRPGARRGRERGSTACAGSRAGDGRARAPPARQRLGVTADCQICLQPLLQRDQSQLLQPADLVAGEHLVLELRERRAAPQPERAAEQLIGSPASPSTISRRPCSSRVSNRCESSSPGSTRTTYPIGRVSTTPSPSTLRSCDTCTWSALTAVAGGRSPHSASTSRSVGIVSPACRSNTASSARCFAAPSSSSRPSCQTASGPRIPNSTPERNTRDEQAPAVLRKG